MVRFVERSRPRPNAAFLVVYSVKLIVEAVPPGTRVSCSVKLLVETVPPRTRVICPVKLFVEAVPPRSLVRLNLTSAK